MGILRRVRAAWRRLFPRGRSYTEDLAQQQRSGRNPNIDGHGGFGGP